jgi:CRP-like cAMP-binding protein
MPVFRAVWVDEVIRIAGTGRQVRHDPGTLLYQEGAPPEHLQVLLDGHVSVRTRAGRTVEVAPPAPLALAEVFQGAPMASTVRTNETVVCLSLTVDECRMLMADNPDLVQGLFGAIIAGQAFAGGRLRLRGEGAADLSRLADEGVRPVERVLALQSISLFSDVSTEELLQLADVARPLVFIEGETLFDVADRPSVFVLLDGQVSLESDGADPVVADQGDAIGVYETLAGVPLGRVARVVERGAALVVDHEDLFDLLGHRPALLQQLFSVLFARQETTTAQVASEA